MLRSSATYDGDGPTADPDIVLPEIETESMIQPHLNMNDVLEQMHYVLEQLQLGKSTESSACGDSKNSSIATPVNEPNIRCCHAITIRIQINY